MEKVNEQAFLSHLRQKWSDRPCPLCHAGPWEVQKTVFELREFSGGGMIIGGVPILPVVPVICTNCGNTVLVNALVAKAIDRPAEGKK